MRTRRRFSVLFTSLVTCDCSGHLYQARSGEWFKRTPTADGGRLATLSPHRVPATCRALFSREVA